MQYLFGAFILLIWGSITVASLAGMFYEYVYVAGFVAGTLVFANFKLQYITYLFGGFI